MSGHSKWATTKHKKAVIDARRGTLEVTDGRHGRPDLVLRADADTWLRFLGGRASLPVALARGRLRLRGNPRLLAAFARCFPT